MPGEGDELIIPVRMDIDGAIRQLQRLAAPGKKAGDDIDAGAKKGKKGLQDLGGGTTRRPRLCSSWARLR